MSLKKTLLTKLIINLESSINYVIYFEIGNFLSIYINFLHLEILFNPVSEIHYVYLVFKVIKCHNLCSINIFFKNNTK